MNTDFQENQQSWQVLIDLSKQMEILAQQNDWQALASLAVERHQRVNQHFTQFPVGPETASFYQQRLSQFMAHEQQLQQLATTARKQVMKHGADLRQGKKANHAYAAAAKS